jgi:hypothetical protein
MLLSPGGGGEDPYERIRQLTAPKPPVDLGRLKEQLGRSVGCDHAGLASVTPISAEALRSLAPAGVEAESRST